MSTSTFIKSAALLVPLLLFMVLWCESCGEASQEEPVVGSWISTDESLKVTLHVTDTIGDSLIASIDFPDQEAWGMPADILFSEDDEILIDIYNIRCGYEGRMNEGGDSLVGSFIDPGGGKSPFTLVRTAAPPVRKSLRPQEPVMPYPYRSGNITFNNVMDGIKLGGTWTIPDGPGPFRAVVLVTGSGPNDRDQLIWGHRTFLVLADYLTRQGIAVLRYDDRGVGRSEGVYEETDFRAFSNDALAACDYLKGMPGIDGDRIGLLGHSEGTAIASLAASQSAEVAFVVLLSSPGNSILNEESGLVSQFRNSYRSNGASEEAIAFKCRLLSRLFEIARVEEDREIARKQMREVVEKSESEWGTLNAEDRSKIDLESIERFNVEWMLSTEFLNILRYDPRAVLAQVTCPVLALHGTKDTQIPVRELNDVEQALRSGGNRHYKVITLEGLNHLFQTAGTGGVGEYQEIEETIAPDVLSRISEWILKVDI